MTVKELIDELLGTMNDDSDQVVVQDSGLVTRVTYGTMPGTGERCIVINDYPPSEDSDAER